MRIQVIGKSKYFIPYRNALARALRKAGCAAYALEHPEFAHEPDAFLVVGPHLYDTYDTGQSSCVWGGVQTEQLTGKRGRVRLERFQSYCQAYDVIFDWRHGEVRELDAFHGGVEFLPHGVFDEINYLERLGEQEEKYDVCFIGDPSGVGGRREKLLSALECEFEVYPAYSGVWNDTKGLAWLQSRICLNLHFDEAPTFESPRLYECLYNGRFVLSEKIADAYPFVEGEDYATVSRSTPEALLESVAYWLHSARKREAMAKRARARAKRFSLDSLAKRIIIRFQKLLCAKTGN